MSSADVEEFCGSLADLTVNSKPHINMLTMLAEDYLAQAPAIVKAVEDQLKHVSGNVKLPVLYLIDSIVKNVGKNYITLFGQNIVNTFTQAFELVDEKARSQMYKLRQTWQIVFPQSKLYALDLKVNAIDPAWPITTPATPTSIHLNPKFLTDPPATQMISHTLSGEKNQQELWKQRKELLELQKRKVELELLQTKAILEEQTKKSSAPSSVVGNIMGVASKPSQPPSFTPITSKPETISVVKPSAANAALVAPVRIRDPRLRIKEGSSKESATSSARKSASEHSLSSRVIPPDNGSNGQKANSLALSGEITSSSPKRDKKKKSKDSKSQRDEVLPSSRSREKIKLSRAEQVLENLKEEQRLTKMHSLGSETVINKAKQHEQSKLKEAKPVSPKRSSKAPSPTPKQQERSTKVTSRFLSPKPAKLTSPKITDTPTSPITAERSSSPKPDLQQMPKLAEEAVPPITAVVSNETPVVSLPLAKQVTPDLETVKLIVPPRERTPEPPPPPMISSSHPDVLRSSGIPPKSLSDHSVSSSMEYRDQPILSKTSSKDDANTPKLKTTSPSRKSVNRERRIPKRKRDRSITPEESPKKAAYSMPARESPDSSATTHLLPEPEALIDSGHDTDLRLLTAKPPVDDSPSKKAKTDDLDDLFGKEDVDLRALPPPAPIISRMSPPSSPVSGSQSPERNKNWANLKRSNSEVSLESNKKTPLRPQERRRSDRFSKHNDDHDEEPSFDDDEERAKERIEMFMKNAEEQVNNGNITFAQYNTMLKEVITMNEKRKLQEAMKRDQDAEVSYGQGNSPDHEETANDHEPSHKRRRKHGDREDSPSYEEEHKKDRDLIHRDSHRRRDNSREKRFSSRDRPPRFEANRNHPPFPGNQPTVRGGFRTRDKFGRWPPAMGQGRPPFEPNHPKFPFRPPMVNYQNVGPGNREVPPADPAVLDMIANDPMKTINIDGIPREIRFYGETAVIMMAYDEPKELSFQPGQRRVTFNDQETISLMFNSPYQEVFINGIPCKVRLGAPTRELYINGVFYEGIFGGPPINVLIGNQRHLVHLHGPLPHVKISTESRKDLVAGKVSLIVDGNDILPIYLDAKPQRFDIGGIPYILRFVEALQTVVINGVPFKIEFGSNLPVPMYFHGEKHYLRFTTLPNGIRPGYITIINMEGGRLPSPGPSLLPQPAIATPTAAEHLPVQENISSIKTQLPRSQSEQQPLELLTSLMPTAGYNPGIGQSYTVEEDSSHPPESSTVPSSVTTDIGSINVGELLKKLVAVGIVPASSPNDRKEVEPSSEIIPVSFDRPESLKTKQPGLVHALYSGMQCSSCGVRFPPEQTGKYSQHLDWHFRQNRRDKDAVRVAQSRRWCYEVSDWIQYQEIEEKEDRAQSWFEIQEKRHSESEDVVEDEPSVPAGEKGENAFCKVCLDVFDQFYNEEKEEWHLKRAVEVDGRLYHPLCHKDYEEKRLAMESAPLAKSTLIMPSDEPELIEIPDDATVDESAVLIMPIDHEVEKVETIDLDSEPSSNSKDGQLEEDPVKSEEPTEEAEESDDDILGIEVLETKIETFELSDDEADRDEEKDETLEKDDAVEEPEKEVDLSKVKKEKVEIVDLDSGSTQPFVVSSIDGNVELEDAAPVSLPRRIKINIASAIIPSKPASAIPVEIPREESPPIESLPVSHSAEPPPPGEELTPQTLKSRLSQVDLKVLPPVEKGSELSGLCSIM